MWSERHSVRRLDARVERVPATRRVRAISNAYTGRRPHVDAGATKIQPLTADEGDEQLSYQCNRLVDRCFVFCIIIKLTVYSLSLIT